MSDDLSIPSPTYRIPRRSHGMDPTTRKLGLIAAGLGGVLVVVVGGWTLIGHRSGTIPVLQADTRPIRVKPENPGGMQVAGANDDIMSGGTDTKGGKLAPPPEVPAPQDLKSPPPLPSIAAAPPVAMPLQAAIPAAPKPVLVPAKPTVTATNLPASPPVKPATTANNDKPGVERSAAAADKRAVTPLQTQAAPNGKLPFVQLAALPSEAAAKTEWQKLEKRMPDVLGRRQPAFSKTEHEGRTYWRVRTGGFSDVAQATQFCERVRAKGTGCSVADF